MNRGNIVAALLAVAIAVFLYTVPDESWSQGALFASVVGAGFVSALVYIFFVVGSRR